MSPQTPPSIYLARQPIYDRRLRLFGYELLYRSSNSESAGSVSRESSASTIVSAITDIGLERLSREVPAFINIPSFLLSDPCLEVLPPDRVVFEILEDTEPTEVALRAASGLAEKGYRIALDDYVPGTPQDEFLPACRIVKVDVLANQAHELPATVAELKRQRKRVLAEKVETMEVFARCQALGFDYFQGYFFARPDVITSRGVPANKAILIHLLTKLQDPKVSLPQLEQLISADVTLAYRLLRLVNSACIAPESPIDSVRAALLVLGLERVVALVSLLAMSGVSDKPTELMVVAMVRAKMCEGVAIAQRYAHPETHFTLGLLSVLEAMFDAPMAGLVEQLPITEELKEALIDPNAPGPLGDSLRVVLAFEAGRWQELEQIWERATAFNESYVAAVRWADEAQVALAA